MSAQPVTDAEAIDVAGSEEEAASEALVLARGHASEIDAPITGGEMAVLYRLGRGLAASGMFKDARQADQAFAKLIFGRDLGLSATQAMTDIHIIEGKPEMSANLQASKVRSSDRYEYEVDELTDERCQLSFYEMQRRPMSGSPDRKLVGVSEFDQEDAETAELTKPTRNGATSNYVKFPRNMLFARAMSNGVAWFCPDVMNGIRVYAEGELADVQRVEQAQSAGSPEVAQAPAESAEPPEATVVEDAPLSDEKRAELIAAFDEAGAKIEMFLTAVGVDCTDDLTENTAFALREKLGAHLQRGAAQ
jgi:hypothetical protein